MTDSEMFVTIIGYLASICMVFGYLPQAIATIRTRDTDGIATPAAIAGFAFGSAVGAIDCLGKNARARGLAHTTRAAEQIGMCKPVLRYRVFKRGG